MSDHRPPPQDASAAPHALGRGAFSGQPAPVPAADAGYTPTPHMHHRPPPQPPQPLQPPQPPQPPQPLQHPPPPGCAPGPPNIAMQEYPAFLPHHTAPSDLYAHASVVVEDLWAQWGQSEVDAFGQYGQQAAPVPGLFPNHQAPYMVSSSEAEMPQVFPAAQPPNAPNAPNAPKGPPPQSQLIPQPASESCLKRKSTESDSENGGMPLNPPKRNSSEARRRRLPPTSARGLPSTFTVAPAEREQSNASRGTGPQGRVIDVSDVGMVVATTLGADLPANDVFRVQVGTHLFKVSGASIMSDAPSYFTHYYNDAKRFNNSGEWPILYLDRDPETFRDIVSHLQGYHVQPQCPQHHARLVADAQYYSLSKLTKQLLTTDIFIRIGRVPFQIRRDLFSRMNKPNFFTDGPAQYFTDLSDAVPGPGLPRPPPIKPPEIPFKCPKVFAEIMKLLQGYDVEIRNAQHRAQLLQDARYYALKGVEQRLIPCRLSYNLMRGQWEILIELKNISQSGISFVADVAPTNPSSGRESMAPSAGGPSPNAGSSLVENLTYLNGNAAPRAGTVAYSKPYMEIPDDRDHPDHPDHPDQGKPKILIMEISSYEAITLHLPREAAKLSRPSSEPFSLDLRVTFHGRTLDRITNLFGVITSRLGLPANQPLGRMLQETGGGLAAQPVSPANSGVSDDRVRVRINSECYMKMDGSEVELGVDTETGRLGLRREGSDQRPVKNHVQGYNNVNGHVNGRERVLSSTQTDPSPWIWGGGKLDPGYSTALGRQEKNGDYYGKDGDEHEEEWTITKSQWKVRVEPVGESGRFEVVLYGVWIEGHSVERYRNKAGGLLNP